MSSTKSISEKESRSSRRFSRSDAAHLDDSAEDGPTGRLSFRSSDSSSRASSRKSLASSNGAEGRSMTPSVSLSHEDEIERIREMRARRLRQEAAAGGGGDDNSKSASIIERVRQRRSDVGVRSATTAASSNYSTKPKPSRFFSTPMKSRRELEDAGFVRKDRRTSSTFLGSEGEEEVLSSYSRTRRERLEAATAGGNSERDSVDSSLAAVNRLDIEERMAERRRSRHLRNPDVSGPSTQMSLDELRSRREEHRSMLARLCRGSSAEPRAVSGGEGEEDDDDELSASLSTRARKRERAGHTRETPRRTKSADQDLMMMRTTAGNLLMASEEKHEEDLDFLDEREARRLERQTRTSVSSSADLSRRLEERRKARAWEERKREIKSTGGSAVDRSGIDQSDSVHLHSENINAIHDLELTDYDTGDVAGPSWSVRLCLVSAMDLPLNVVPNTPLCPILKLGLVKLSTSTSIYDEASATDLVLKKLGRNSVESVKSAQVRTTTQKLLGKRDNGTVDFHEEYRWDLSEEPKNIGLCVELFARAVHPPKNYMLSPSTLSQRAAYTVQERSYSSNKSNSCSGSNQEPVRGVLRAPSGSEDNGGLRNFWISNKKQAELESAEAAAAVARMLVEQDSEGNQRSDVIAIGPKKLMSSPQTDYEVTLRRDARDSLSFGMTEDERLGTIVIPLAKLPLDKARQLHETVRLEQWFQLEVSDESIGVSQRRKQPSVLLEMSFSVPEVLDDSEDELDDAEVDLDAHGNHSKTRSELVNASFSRRSRVESLGQQKSEQEKPKEESTVEDPELEPGVFDFLTVVGCRDIGKQKNDDGSKGWVKSNPESVILEQFPQESDYHMKNGRSALLPEMVQWFCFPEGVRLWRGTGPPSHTDLSFKRFSAASPPNIASSFAAFDACLNCTTSFSWFVIASNSDEYGSSLVKTYGAAIRFYVPAPTGIDPTQDDFAQSLTRNVATESSVSRPTKRLWVPMGICFTSSLPIVGILEALLLRLCEELTGISVWEEASKLEEIHKVIANMILNFQKPIAGAVNCSVPFFLGDRFLLSLPPPTGLPPLPHGRAVVSTCRLLGAEGVNYLISAVLTECKILIHSQEIADIAMVAEVITAITYPFVWSLPYIPILPLGMLEFVEAPMPYILGIPSCNLVLVDPRGLDDVVVIDLDNGFSAMDIYNSRRQSKGGNNKHPTPLPTPVATCISKAVYKLIRLEEEMEEEFGAPDFGEQVLPRLESESLAEREFRVSVAIEICGLLRGYQDCVATVFDRDKFLKIAPALYEERRDHRGVGASLGSRSGVASQSKVFSARSKRFLSLLVNGQNFQQLVESLGNTEASFFHEIMELIDENSSETKPHLAMRTSSTDTNGTTKKERHVQHLMKSLQNVEDKIPTYRVEKGGGILPDDGESDFYFDGDFDECDANSETLTSKNGENPTFTSRMLSPIDSCSVAIESSEPGKQSLSMEYLAKLEETPWKYNALFDIPLENNAAEEPIVKINPKVKLRDAIGERRFRAWKSSQDQKPGVDVDLAFLPENTRTADKHGAALDLTSLVTSAKNDMSDMSASSIWNSSLRTSSLSPEQQKLADAKSRDIIRRCLDKAQGEGVFVENGRDLIAEAEKALRNHSAQLFLLKILAQRSRLESQRNRSIRRQTAVTNSVSRLDPVAFNCLVRLSCAMLDACMEFAEFEPAYRLLTNTAGFIMVLENSDDETQVGEAQPRTVITMTSRVGLHPLFADLGVWETVMKLHMRDRKTAKKLEDTRPGQGEESGDEDEDEVEYEAAVATLYEMVGYGIPGEELSRFAMRASEENGWFCDDRGRQLLMLARRISIRRDQADVGTGDAGDIDMIRKGPDSTNSAAASSDGVVLGEKMEYSWNDICWCHPAAPSSRTSFGMAENVEAMASPRTDDYMKRSAVTAVASFGTTIVVSGGLDGGVFMAHSIDDGSTNNEASGCGKTPVVRGIHLDWGSASRAGTGVSSDGEYGVGAVSCLAAAFGGGHHSHNPTPMKDTSDELDEMDFADSMEGSRIVAGTTAGDLRVWSVKDIYSAILLTKNQDESSGNRLKFSLKGKALSGHRGGVTCIDVPSQVYRPDSLVTGGVDGLIKLWSLRAPTSSRRTPVDPDINGGGGNQQRGRGGDALHTLYGHMGRILCIKTAWHGDHLLSGGADRTLRVWDLASSGGKSLQTLCGHFGWVTNVQYWGPNTIVSASTDRSVALWDARVRNFPLFMLRHHHSPISDLLVGSRTDPFMVSAATDGSIAAWDFRLLSDASNAQFGSDKKDRNKKACMVVREPSVSMHHGGSAAGPTFLARSVKDPMSAFLSVGPDAILREWDFLNANILEQDPTGHCDGITSFESFSHGFGFGSLFTRGGSENASMNKGILTSSLDGTVRIRKLIPQSEDKCL